MLRTAAPATSIAPRTRATIWARKPDSSATSAALDPVRVVTEDPRHHHDLEEVGVVAGAPDTGTPGDRGTRYGNGLIPA